MALLIWTVPEGGEPVHRAVLTTVTPWVDVTNPKCDHKLDVTSTLTLVSLCCKKLVTTQCDHMSSVTSNSARHNLSQSKPKRMLLGEWSQNKTCGELTSKTRDFLWPHATPLLVVTVWSQITLFVMSTLHSFGHRSNPFALVWFLTLISSCFHFHLHMAWLSNWHLNINDTGCKNQKTGYFHHQFQISLTR